jgi:hypothetical protein
MMITAPGRGGSTNGGKWMRVCRHLRNPRVWAPLSALLFANGCFAAFERNLDYVLAPGALENTLFLPFSSVAPLVQFLLRFVP